MNITIRLLMLFFFVATTNTEAGSITGNIKLPDPYTQTGDMQIWVRATTHDPYDQKQQLLTITQAQATPGALIGFTINNLIDGEPYELRYDCSSFLYPGPCMNIVETAYYQATNKSVLRSVDATQIPGADTTTGIEFPLMTGITISGEMHLPLGELTPTGGLNFRINAKTVATPTIDLEVVGFINGGDSLGNYQITLPDHAADTWTINYQCNVHQNTTNGACDDFVSRGYYHSLATNSTEEFLVDAEALPGDQSSTNIDMTFISSLKISGELSVPIAPTEASGIDVRMVAQNLNHPSSHLNIINIEQGATSAPYSITIPSDAGSIWIVRYSCEVASSPVECARYIRNGYFDSGTADTMTSTSQSEADQLAGGQSHSDINFSMITGLSISGNLKLSQGVAPAGGIVFTVLAVDTSDSGSVGSTTVTIPEGANEVMYAINVDSGGTNLWRISFNCQEAQSPICLEIADRGYYNATTGNTEDDVSNAVELPGGIAHSNINLIVESSALPAQELCMPIRATSGSVVLICL